MTVRPKSLDDIKRKASTTLMAEVSEAELAVRIIETMGSCRRPAGMTAEQVLAMTPSDAVANARSVARMAVAYMAECFAGAVRPQ